MQYTYIYVYILHCIVNTIFVRTYNIQNLVEELRGMNKFEEIIVVVFFYDT